MDEISRTFERFRAATSIVNKDTKYFERVQYWHYKRQTLKFLLAEFPSLIAAFKNRASRPYALSPLITQHDQAPEFRLIMACEGATNSLYALAEVSAQFASIASGKTLSASFNQIRKKARSGKLDPALIEALGDLQWYERVREARTEWAHYSAAFMVYPDDEPAVMVYPFRSHGDRQHLPSQTSLRVSEVASWVGKAIESIDGFAGYLLTTHVVPRFDLDAAVTDVNRDENGYPVILEGGGFSTRKTTVREYLARNGIIDPVDDPS